MEYQSVTTYLYKQNTEHKNMTEHACPKWSSKCVISQDFSGCWNFKPDFIVSYYVRKDRALLISLWYITLQEISDISFQSFRLSLHIFPFIYGVRYYLGDQIKKNETGEVCGTYRREEMCIQGFGGETWGKKTTCNTLAQMGEQY